MTEKPTRKPREPNYTDAERALITEMFLAYAPTLEIAHRLNRTEGSIRQQIVRLKLKRSGVVTRTLAWAPEHLKEELPSIGAQAFLEKCYAWRDGIAGADSDADKKELDARIQEIMALHNIPRFQKMTALRVAGASTRQIGNLFGVSYQRVAQITDPKNAKMDDTGTGLTGRQFRSLTVQLASIEKSRMAIRAALVEQITEMWNTLDPDLQDVFLEKVGLSRTVGNDRSTG